MKRELIAHLYADMQAYGGKEVILGGWARSIRDSKAFGFIDLNDGSCFKSAQVVFEREKIANYDICANRRICVPAPTCFPLSSVCAVRSRLPFTASSMTGDLSMCIPR